MKNSETRRRGRMCPVVTLDTTFPEIDPAVSLVTSARGEGSKDLQTSGQYDPDSARKQTARGAERSARDQKPLTDRQRLGDAKLGQTQTTDDVELGVEGESCLTRRPKYTRRSRHHDPTDLPAVVGRDRKQSARITRLQSEIAARSVQRLPPISVNNGISGSMSMSAEVPVTGSRKLKVRHTKKTAQVKAIRHKQTESNSIIPVVKQQPNEVIGHHQVQLRDQISGQSSPADHWMNRVKLLVDGAKQNQTTLSRAPENEQISVKSDTQSGGSEMYSDWIPGEGNQEILPLSLDDRDVSKLQTATDDERLAPRMRDVQQPNARHMKAESLDEQETDTDIDIDLGVEGESYLSRRPKYTRRSRHHDPTDLPAVVGRDRKQSARITRLQKEIAARSVQRLPPISANNDIAGSMQMSAEVPATGSRKLKVRHTKKTAQVKAIRHKQTESNSTIPGVKQPPTEVIGHHQVQLSDQIYGQSSPADHWMKRVALLVDGAEQSPTELPGTADNKQKLLKSDTLSDGSEMFSDWMPGNINHEVMSLLLDDRGVSKLQTTTDGEQPVPRMRDKEQPYGSQLKDETLDEQETITDVDIDIELGVEGESCLTRRPKYTRRSRHHDPTDLPAVVGRDRKQSARITRLQSEIAARSVQRLPPISANNGIAGSKPMSAEVPATCSRKLKVRHTKKTAQVKAIRHKQIESNSIMPVDGLQDNPKPFDNIAREKHHGFDHEPTSVSWLERTEVRNAGKNNTGLSSAAKNKPALDTSHKEDEVNGPRKLKVRHTRKTAQIKSNRQASKRIQDPDTGPSIRGPVKLVIQNANKEPRGDLLRHEQYEVSHDNTIENPDRGPVHREPRSMCIGVNATNQHRGHENNESHTVRLIIHYDDPKSPAETVSPTAPATPSPVLTLSRGVEDDTGLTVVKEWDCSDELENGNYGSGNITPITSTISPPVATYSEEKQGIEGKGSYASPHATQSGKCNSEDTTDVIQKTHTPVLKSSPATKSSLQIMPQVKARLSTNTPNGQSPTDMSITPDNEDTVRLPEASGSYSPTNRASTDSSTKRDGSFHTGAYADTPCVTPARSLCSVSPLTGTSRKKREGLNSPKVHNKASAPFEHHARREAGVGKTPDNQRIKSQTSMETNKTSVSQRKKSQTSMETGKISASQRIKSRASMETDKTSARQTINSPTSVETNKTSVSQRIKSQASMETDKTPVSQSIKSSISIEKHSFTFRGASRTSATSANSVATERTSRCSSLRASTSTPRSIRSEKCRTVTPGTPRSRQPSAVTIKSECSTAKGSSRRSSAASQVYSERCCSGKSSTGNELKYESSSARGSGAKAYSRNSDKSTCNTARGSDRKSSSRNVETSVCSTARGSIGEIEKTGTGVNRMPSTVRCFSRQSSAESGSTTPCSSARGISRKSSAMSDYNTTPGSSRNKSRGSDVSSPRWRY